MSSPRHSKKQQGRWQQLKKKIEGIRKDKVSSLPGTWSREEANEFYLLLDELFRRDAETVNVMTPLPVAEKFHREMAHEVALAGGNRSGKTCAASSEVGMAATGTHYVKGKYPLQDVSIACIGNDGRHLSLMYEYLFEKAPYQVFQHPKTHKWHVVNQDQHAEFKDLWQDAQPVIPPRMVKHVSWEKKKEKIPRLVTLHNGTKIRFYSGLVRKMPQGRKFHLVWMDEEIENAEKWLSEMRARIVDFNGRIIWSATPQNASEQFLDMEFRSEDPENRTKPLSQQNAYYNMIPEDNIYISAEGRAAFKAKLSKNHEEMQIRYYGKSARAFLIVYPMFNPAMNQIPMFNMRWEDTRYLVFDPGVDVAGVLFCAVPAIVDDPDELAKMTEQERWYRTRPGCIVVYDELYIRQASAPLVASRVRQKLDTHQFMNIHEMVIDEMGSKSMIWKGMPVDQNPGTIYMEQLLKHDVKAQEPGWRYGSSDKKYGIERTRDYITPSFEDGLPHLFIVAHCEKVLHEMKVWKKTRNKDGEFVDYEKGNCHLLDCIRYATTKGLMWVPPPADVGPKAYNREDFRRAVNNLKSGKAFFS